MSAEELSWWRETATVDELKAWRAWAEGSVRYHEWPDHESSDDELRDARQELSLVLSIIGERMVGGR